MNPPSRSIMSPVDALEATTIQFNGGFGRPGAGPTAKLGIFPDTATTHTRVPSSCEEPWPMLGSAAWNSPNVVNLALAE